MLNQLDAMVEGSLNWSYLVEDDLPALAELLLAIEYMDDPIEHLDLADLSELFNSAKDQIAVVGRDRGATVVAYAWNRYEYPESGPVQTWLRTGVHPGWRHRKIGRKLVDWSIRTALEHHSESAESGRDLWIGMTLDEKFTGLQHVMSEFGLKAQRFFFDMHRELDSEIPDMPLPPGVRIQQYSTLMSEEIRVLHNEVVSQMAGSRRVDRESWETSLKRGEHAPELSWVAISMSSGGGHEQVLHGDYVGYALNSVLSEQVESGEYREGWTELLGVCPNWQGLGVGAALLAASARGFAEAGLDAAGLGADTDEPSDAEHLMTSIGYQMSDQLILFGKVFVSGLDFEPKTDDSLT